MLFVDYSRCTGCRACENACPTKAITMECDEEGFAYPRVEQEKCVSCNLCNQVCPISKSEGKEATYYVVHNRSPEQRAKSQSGGLFSAMAEVVLQNHGVCYGAAVGDDFVVEQERITCVDELTKLQGSKYVQSDPLHTYQEVRKDLNDGKIVLYSGTSCMISGLRRFLDTTRTASEKLITCDFICHGVPSPQIWQENVRRQEKRHGKLKKVNFRDKKFGWHAHMETYSFEHGEQISENYYTDLFYTHGILRKCCYSCEYLDTEKKQSDITMADFWGIKSGKVAMTDDNTGISLAVVHTEKGAQLLEKANLSIIETDKETALNNNMSHSAQAPSWRERFWKDYRRKGYEFCLKKYTIYGGIGFKMKRKIMKMLNQW